tara:strand:+ start:1222 stop:2043 length:822 start_codon:yes stop_codon:yes gene_type:complete
MEIRNRKLLFILLKGLGDTMILLNFLSSIKLNNNEVAIICSQKQKFLLPFFPRNIKIIWVPDNYSFLYFLRTKLHNVFDIFKLRNLIKDYISKGFELTFFDSHFKNKLFFFNIKKKLFKSRQIYRNLESYFTLQINYELKKISNKVIIFPFGNTKNRQLSNGMMSEIINHFSTSKYEVKFVVHKSCNNLVNDVIKKHSLIYESIEQLLEIIDEKPNIITVDTFFLHLAIMKKLNIYILSNSWHDYIPDYLIDNNRLFNFQDITSLLNNFHDDH